MSNKLTKLGIPAWGENLSKFLTICRQEGDEELVQQVEDKLTAGYLLAMRKELEENPAARDIIIQCNPATNAWGALSEKFWHLVKLGSEDLFEKALYTLLEELDSMRRMEPSLYLVSSETGKAIMPISPNSIFQPPDFIDENGIQRPAKPIVHPAITSSLALLAQKGAKLESLQRKVKDPFKRAALAHLSGLKSIIQSAEDRLLAIGVKPSNLQDEESSHELEFGRDQIDGIYQAPNYSFHRANIFSAVLAQKILKLCGPNGSYQILEAKECKSSTQIWFMVNVKIRAVLQLLPNPEDKPEPPQGQI